MSWLAIAGVALFAALFGAESASAGLLMLGVGLGWALRRAQRRIDRLESLLEQAQADRAPAAARAATPASASAAPRAGTEAPSELRPVQPADVAAPVPVPVPVPVPSPQPAVARASAPAAASRPAEPAADDAFTRVTSSVGQTLLAWFRGGNTIVRLGVVILFFGVAFLLRFAAEHALLPIEWRLAGVALGGAALCVTGWHLRARRRGYGLSLQGAGIGVLYLVIFAGLRLYGLLPPPLAFALLVALSALTALLAVAQDALVLAVLGFGGAFLAPVLASTGQGSHVMLFGYFLVLNLAIAWIASRQAWKLLNLVGFGFTFSIGGAWGLRSYTPELYFSTQLFLALHFALYLFISVQYSRQLAAARDEARLRVVDGGLLFGLPIAAFAMQAGLVRHLPYGLALSAAALSAVYLLLGRWLWRHAGDRLRLLTEGLLALGLIFLVLVTPLALDARWTAAAWSVQGAGILWIALRQRRGWAAAIGLLLQWMAAASFWEPARPESALPFANAHLLGALLLGGSALVSARLLRRAADEGETVLPWPGARPMPREWPLGLHWLMLGLGLLQALTGLWQELDALTVSTPDAVTRGVLLLAVAAAALDVARRRLAWAELGVAARVLVSVGAAQALAELADRAFSPSALLRHLLPGAGWAALAALLAVGVWLQRGLRADGPWRRSTGAEHLLLGWTVAAHGAALGYAVAAEWVQRHESWTPVGLILVPLGLAWWTASRLQHGTWPASAHPAAWRRGFLLPMLALLAVWCLGTDAFADGGMAPLPHLPLLNPLDLAHGAVALLALRAWRAGLLAPRPLALGGAGLGLVWLSSVLVRALHHGYGTPLWFHGALDSGLVQTGLTILWTVLSLLTMGLAARRAPATAARPVWLAGAGLLAVVVLKLFFVDLSSIGTLERIVSFLGVGGLMLVIGYVSPMPPAAGARKAAA